MQPAQAAKINTFYRYIAHVGDRCYQRCSSPESSSCSIHFSFLFCLYSLLLRLVERLKEAEPLSDVCCGEREGKPRHVIPYSHSAPSVVKPCYFQHFNMAWLPRPGAKNSFQMNEVCISVIKVSVQFLVVLNIAAVGKFPLFFLMPHLSTLL